MPVKSRRSAENAIAKVLRHPLRVRIWAILDNRTASPAELSVELDEPLGNVAYHVRELEKFECIELVGQKPVRGAMEHFFRAIRRPYFQDAEWGQLPVGARHAISGSIVQMTYDEVGRSFDAGVFDAHEDRHLSRTPLVLDDQAWKDMNAMLNEMVERALDLQAEAAERLSGSGESGMSVRMVLMGFESGSEANVETE